MQRIQDRLGAGRSSIRTSITGVTALNAALHHLNGLVLWILFERCLYFLLPLHPRLVLQSNLNYPFWLRILERSSLRANLDSYSIAQGRSSWSVTLNFGPTLFLDSPNHLLFTKIFRNNPPRPKRNRIMILIISTSVNSIHGHFHGSPTMWLGGT